MLQLFQQFFPFFTVQSVCKSFHFSEDETLLSTLLSFSRTPEAIQGQQIGTEYIDRIGNQSNFILTRIALDLHLQVTFAQRT